MLQYAKTKHELNFTPEVKDAGVLSRVESLIARNNVGEQLRHLNYTGARGNEPAYQDNNKSKKRI